MVASVFGRMSLQVVALLALAPVAAATNPIYNHWKTIYPTSLSDDNIIAVNAVGCQMCHRDAGGFEPWNAYGWRVRLGIVGGMTIDDAILAAASFDSDADPTASTNLEEIVADAQPGWTYGAVNTWYFANGTTQRGKSPPGAGGFLNTVWTKFVAAALPGSNGLPDLKGLGPLTAGNTMALNLGGAKPSSPAVLVVGLAQIDAPFKGGTLVPSVDSLVPMVTTASGVILINATWPAGVPPGFDFWLQYWITDPAGPQGFAASNGLQGTAN
jgi:hypothetical protein